MSNFPGPHSDWLAEKELTQGKQGWKEEILGTVKAYLRLAKAELWADRVGFKKNEVQIQFTDPVLQVLKYVPLGLLWVQFNTWDAQTKKPATRVVRFGPDVALLMVLVKSGNKMFLLARRKYQFAGKDSYTEFSRGWINGAMKDDQGWKLLERDFPGIKGSSLVGSIEEKPMGTPILENDAEYANKISHHLIVITMKDEVSKEDLEKLLVEAKLRQEYPDANLGDLDKDDLTSQPLVLEMSEAAKLLNAHLSGNGAILALFGENFSINCWSRFLALYGKQFPDLLPESRVKI